MELELLIKHKENLYGNKPLYTKFKFMKNYKPSFEGVLHSGRKDPTKAINRFKDIMDSIRCKEFDDMCKLPECAIIIKTIHKDDYHLDLFHNLLLCHIGIDDNYTTFAENVYSAMQNYKTEQISSSNELYKNNINGHKIRSIKMVKHSYKSINDLLYSHVIPECQIAIYKNRLFATLLGKHYIETYYSIIDAMFLPDPRVYISNYTIVIGDRYDHYKKMFERSKYGKKLPIIYNSIKCGNNTIDKLNAILHILTKCILLGSTSYVFTKGIYKNKEELILEAQKLLHKLKIDDCIPTYLILHNILVSTKRNEYKNTPHFNWFNNLSIFVSECRKSPNEMPLIKKRYMNPYLIPRINKRTIKCNSRLISAHDNRLLKIYMMLSYYVVPDILQMVMFNIMLLDKLNYSNIKIWNTSLYPWLKGYLINNSVIKCPMNDNYKSIDMLLRDLNKKITNHVSDRTKKSIMSIRDTIIKKYNLVGYTFEAY